MDNTSGSHYDRLLAQVQEDMGMCPVDSEKEIRIAFENTDMGRSLDINEWDVVYEGDQWWIVADNGSQWSVNETENAEAPFQFDLVEETNESQVDEEEMDQDGAEYAVDEDQKVDEEEEKDEEKKDKEEGGSGGLKGTIDDLYKKAERNPDREEKEEEKKEEDDTTDDFLAGGDADDAEDGDFDPEQLRMGQHHELEHTSNPAVALEIAKDHLKGDPLYYTKLKRMEAGECDHPEDEELYKKMGRGKRKEEAE